MTIYTYEKMIERITLDLTLANNKLGVHRYEFFCSLSYRWFRKRY
jgi:hypothetical protein